MMCYNNAVKGTLLCACAIMHLSATICGPPRFYSLCFKSLPRHIPFCRCQLFSSHISVRALETLKWMHKNFMRHLCEDKAHQKSYMHEKVMTEHFEMAAKTPTPHAIQHAL